MEHRRRRSRTPGPSLSPNQIAGTGLLSALLLFLLPPLMALPLSTDPTPSIPQGTLPIHHPVQTGVHRRDRGRVVKLLQPDGSIASMDMVDYLFGVVAAEMPASFELEALKAQACAARTYTVVKQTKPSPNHPQADVCTEIQCCQAYSSPEESAARWGEHTASYTAKLQTAIGQTDGLGILYEGRPIQAVFFSSAAGQTMDAVEVWGNQVDYLQGVPSPEGEEVPNYHSQVTFTPDQVRQRIQATFPQADLSAPPDQWFQEIQTTPSGHISSITVGGLPLTGSQLRALFSLRSTHFTVSFDGSTFLFSVTGYGHGVGMSQYGANAMAKEGSTYDAILTWYYTGASVAPLW